MNYDLIIFDCDGTIVDTELLYNSVISNILIEYGLSEYTPDACLEHFTGLTLSNIRGVVEQKHNVDLAAVLTSDLYVGRAQAEMDKGINAIKGANELLRFCKSQTKICVASNGERSSVIKSMKLVELYNYFGGHDDDIFTKIQVDNPKPAPDLFLYAAKQMGIEPQNCLVIEDSVAGVQAGIAANMSVFGYTGSHPDPQSHANTLKSAGACETFSSLIHIVEHLKGQKEFRNVS